MIFPVEDFGGNGPLLHFGHANGYPPAAYQSFLRPLTQQYRVKAMHWRPLWPGSEPEALKSWSELSDDFLDWLEAEVSEPVIGAGHSLGAVVTLLAAAKRPELFSSLILIEPVFLPPKLLWLLRFFPDFLMQRFHPLIPQTLRRRTQWKSTEEMFASFRQKQVFSEISDKVLREFVEAAVRSVEDGQVELVYSKEWEARIYALPPQVWQALESLPFPVTGFRATHTDTVLPSAWEHWKQLRPQDRLVEIPDTTHLVPLETPEALASQVLQFLSEN